MRRILFLLFVILFSHSVWATPIFLTGMFIESTKQQTDVMFLLSEKTFGKVKYIPHPHRVIIEFKNTTQHFDIPALQFKQSNVYSMQVKKLPLALQVTFFTQTPIHPIVKFIPTKAGGAQLKLEMISIAPVAATKKIKSTSLAVNKVATKIKSIKPAISPSPVLSTRPAQVLAESTKPTTKIFTVMIDAGHGGRDPGAKGAKGTQEKKVVLAIAKKLVKEINEQPNIRAVLTRKSDEFVPLYQRLKLTRQAEADLFVAIHADAHFNVAATGASVYILSTHGASTVAARWLAQKENHEELNDVELNALQDQSYMLRSVLIDLAQTKTAQNSVRLGNSVLDSLEEITPLHYKHVERAPFLVLKSPDIPSILVETGFLSNAREEQRLRDPQFQAKIAHALRLGIVQYIKKQQY